MPILLEATCSRRPVRSGAPWFFPSTDMSIEQMSIEQSAGMPTSCARQVPRGGHTCSMA